MNFESLRILIAVARLRSFSKAAKELNMTQPAVSTAIQHLERDVDAQLLDRSHRPLQLTSAGERMLVAAQVILDELDHALADIQGMENDMAGVLPIASIYSVGLYHSQGIQKFMEAHPRVAVRLQYLRPNLVIDAVRNGQALLGLISYPKKTNELGVIPWREEEMVIVCQRNSPLANRANVPITELSGQKLIGFDPDLEIRRRTDAALKGHNVSVDVVLEFDNIETVKQAVQVGSGIALLPADTVRREVEAGELAVVRLDPPNLRRPVGIIYRLHHPMPAVATRFVESLVGHPVPTLRSPSSP